MLVRKKRTKITNLCLITVPSLTLCIVIVTFVGFVVVVIVVCVQVTNLDLFVLGYSCVSELTVGHTTCDHFDPLHN